MRKNIFQKNHSKLLDEISSNFPHLLIAKKLTSGDLTSGGSREECQGGGAQAKFCMFFHEICINNKKMKKKNTFFGPQGGGDRPYRPPPLDPPLDLTVLF